MDLDQNQQAEPNSLSTQEITNTPQLSNSKLLKIFLIILGILIVIGVGISGYVFGIKHSQSVAPTVAPTPTKIPIVYVDFKDEAKIFTLKIPQNYGANGLYSYITDSCTLFSDKSIVNPGISASEAAILEKNGTFIEVCYISNSLPNPVPNNLISPEDNFTILSSAPFSINGYSGLQAQVSSKNTQVQELVILKSPYSGYVTITRQANGQEVFDKVISTFTFIPQVTKRFSTADQTLIRKLFSDQYKKDITSTFGYWSSDQNSVGGMVYLPQGQRCFNAERTETGWRISYVGTGIFDPECDNFSPPISPTP